MLDTILNTDIKKGKKYCVQKVEYGIASFKIKYIYIYEIDLFANRTFCMKAVCYLSAKLTILILPKLGIWEAGSIINYIVKVSFCQGNQYQYCIVSFKFF